ncbi:serine hydrolase domain-containing protein [uncultured Aquimarina sp.]|uniref:serine hydrolase domain-containing protein n=1 Tax=uncultured Aquimarina sp. TaxID=575652 RepID=UPI0026067F6A|nr:serine hydrolase domain-containing protein [uncultured Aquimarina sp.]
MKKASLYTVILTLLMCTIPLNSQSQSNNNDINEYSEIETVAEAFMQQTKIPGFSIAISKNGEILYAKGFGYATIEQHIKMETTTLLRTASVAKVITATAIGKLVSEGKIDLDAPIKNYISYIDEKYANITSRQLAGHTSGLAHRPNGNSYKKKQYQSIKETVNLMQASLLFDPDTDYKYSTHAFNLLAAVIEGASGKSYIDYMNDHIFKPLQMTQTAAENIEKLSKENASLYYLKNEKLHKEKITNASYKIPGAGFRSTPSDLVKMMNGYTNGFISKEVVKEMFKSHQLKNGKKTNVGVVWRSSYDAFGNNVLEHAGSWRGARTVIVHYPKEQLNIAIMINADCPIFIEETAHNFAQLFRNIKQIQPIGDHIKEDIKLTFNASKKIEVFNGIFITNGTNGILKTNSDGFLKENPVYSVDNQNNYALATYYGLLHTNLIHKPKLQGKAYIYSNRNASNPTLEKPAITFEAVDID